MRNEFRLCRDRHIWWDLVNELLSERCMCRWRWPTEALREWHMPMKVEIGSDRAKKDKSEEHSQNATLHTISMPPHGKGQMSISESLPSFLFDWFPVDPDQAGQPEKEDKRFDRSNDQYRDDLGIVLIE